MLVGVPKETMTGERRVAATPDTIQRLRKMGFAVLVESGAGVQASYLDVAYEAAGATIAASAAEVWEKADIITKVCVPSLDEVELLGEGKTLISLVRPGQNEALLDAMAKRKANVIALDCIPRISRAQKLDVLSSMANIAGYRAIIEAAGIYGGFFGGQITAAGKTRPAHVLVIGAGVAGLAAIAAARSLGAVVKAFDTREAVREQVQSLGAEFLELEFEESGDGGGGYAKLMSKEFIEAEMTLFRKEAKTTDIIVTTALIPGRPAPLLVPADVVANLKPGSVIVDMAAETGGNCELTVKDEVIVHNGVHIAGFTDLTSRLPSHASQFFATNIRHLLGDMGGGEDWKIDLDDEVVRDSLIFHNGEKMWPPPKRERPAPPPPPPVESMPPPSSSKKKKHGHGGGEPSTGMGQPIALLFAAILLAGLAYSAEAAFLQHVTVFVLACFVGYQVVWNVAPALHTPLMSVTNAISGIIIVGGILQVGKWQFSTESAGQSDVNLLAVGLGVAAIFVASINVFGGFIVTQRMLKMFRK